MPAPSSLPLLTDCIGHISLGYGLFRRSKIQGAVIGLCANFSIHLGYSSEEGLERCFLTRERPDFFLNLLSFDPLVGFVAILLGGR
jgi:hypothetical protein